MTATRPMQKKAAWAIWIISTAGLLFSPVCRDAIAELSTKHVLVLNSYHRSYTWTDNQIQGIMAGLKKYPGTVELHIEYMDVKRLVPTPYYLNQLENLYRTKYKVFPLSLIICTDNDALDFIVARHKTLFPGIPVVFCGVNEFSEEMLKGDRLITGIAENPDVKATILLARTMNPQLKRVVVIFDDTTSGQHDVALARKAAEALKNEMTFDFSCWGRTKSLQEVLNYIAPLSREDTIVLYANFFRDRSGNYYIPEVVVPLICNTTQIPVYILSGAYLGLGPIGGEIIEGQIHGQIAGEIGVRILRGEPAGKIPVVMHGPTTKVFDYKVLVRFGFSESDIPPDSKTINKPITFYSQYKKLIWTTLSVILVLSSLSLILAINIFRRKQAEQTLMDREAMLRSIFDASPIGIVLVIDRVFQKVNRTYCKMIGYSAEEVIGQDARFLYPDEEEYQRVGRELYKKTQETGMGIVETIHKRKDGKLVNILLGWNPIDPHDWSKGITTIVMDITDKKQAEQTLKDSEAMLRSIFDASPVGTTFITADRTFLKMNRWFCKMTGYSNDELAGHDARILYADNEEYQRVGRELYQKAREEGMGIIESVFRRKDGKLINVLLSCSPIDPANWSRGLATTAIDITDRIQAEQALKESEAMLRSIFEASPAGASIVINRTFIKVNRWFCKSMGYSAEELIGQNTRILYPDEEEYQRVGRELYQAVREKGTGIVETVHKRKDGKFINVLLGCSPIDPGDWSKGLTTILMDITDRKQAEQALKDSEAMLRSLFDATPAGTAFTTSDRIFLKVNRRFCMMTGYSPEEVIGQSTRILYPDDEEYQRMGREFLQKTRKEGFGITETVFKCKDGKLINVLLSCCPIDTDDWSKGLTTTITDITDRKQAELALKESEAMLRSMFDAAPVGTTMTVDRVFKKVNRWLCKILGYSMEELTNHSTRIAYADDAEYERAGRELYGQVRDKGFGMVEARLQHKDGRMIDAIITSNPIDPADWKKGQTTTIMDITDLKHAQEALKLDEMRLETLLQLNQMPETDLDTISNFAMEEAVRLTQSKLGYVAFTNEDETIMTIHAWSKLAKEECRVSGNPIAYPIKDTGLWGEAIRQRRPIITNDYAAENPLKKGVPEGHVKMIRHMNVPIFAGDKIVIVAGVANKETDYDQTDVRQLTLLMAGVWRIIERKRIEDEIRQLNRNLEHRVQERTTELNEANKELEAFAYSISHDLRAPLRSIAGFSQILMEDQKERLDQDGQQLLGRVNAAAHRMEQLIDALLHFSRMIRAPLRRSSINLSELAQEITAGLKESEPKRVVDFAIVPNLIVQADPDLIRIVMENLLGNAWKYTRNHPRSKIEFGMEQKENERIYFVRDDGAGFNEAYAGKLFQAFQRLHRTEEFEGTGIGLASVARIVRRHGGRIWAHGEVEQGATFYFTLP